MRYYLQNERDMLYYKQNLNFCKQVILDWLGIRGILNLPFRPCSSSIDLCIGLSFYFEYQSSVPLYGTEPCQGPVFTIYWTIRSLGSNFNLNLKAVLTTIISIQVPKKQMSYHSYIPFNSESYRKVTRNWASLKLRSHQLLVKLTEQAIVDL